MIYRNEIDVDDLYEFYNFLYYLIFSPLFRDENVGCDKNNATIKEALHQFANYNSPTYTFISSFFGQNQFNKFTLRFPDKSVEESYLF